jgi:hypothetical protein
MILLVCLAGAALGAPISIVKVPLQSGERWRVEASTSGALHASLATADLPPTDEGAMEDEVDDRSRFDVEVLATAPDGEMRLRITYGEVSSKRKAAFFGEKVVPLPVAGRTFVVDARGSDVVVRDGGGEEASALEAAIVVRDVRDLGRPLPLHRALPDRPLELGETIALAPDDASLLFGDVALLGEVVPFTSAALVVRGVRQEAGGDVAVFAVHARLASRSGDDDLPLARGIDLTGEMRVSLAGGRLVSLALTGITHVESTRGSKILAVTGDGTVALSRTETPSPPAPRGPR